MTVSMSTSTTQVDSSAIRLVSYNAYDETLIIEFTSGKVYAYSGVEPETYLDLIGDESAGHYFNNDIRGFYDYKLLSA